MRKINRVQEIGAPSTQKSVTRAYRVCYGITSVNRGRLGLHRCLHRVDC